MVACSPGLGLRSGRPMYTGGRPPTRKPRAALCFWMEIGEACRGGGLGASGQARCVAKLTPGDWCSDCSRNPAGRDRESERGKEAVS